MLLFGSAAVKAWTESAAKVQLLQQQCGRTGAGLQQPQQSHILTLGHDDLDMTETDVQLLLGLKVPRQLASAVCGPLETEQHAIACHGAATLLGNLMRIILRARDDHGLSEVLSRQLQQSGLLQQLPALIPAAQRLLAKESQALATASATGAAFLTPAGSPCSGSAVLHVCFSLVEIMQRLWYMTEGVIKDFMWDQPATSAAVSLAVSALQHLHLVVPYLATAAADDRHGAAQISSRAAQYSLEEVLIGSRTAQNILISAVSMWKFLVDVLSRPTIWKDQLPPAVVAAGLGMTVMAGSLSQHMRQVGLQTPHNAPSFEPATVAWCWQVADSPSDEGVGNLPTHLVLPPHLEQLLGCDNRTLRWLAAGIFAESATRGVGDAGSCASDLAKAVFHTAFALHPSQQQQQQQVQQQQQHSELELYLLLSSLLMVSVAQYAKPEKLTTCHYWAVACADTTIMVYKHCCWPPSAPEEGPHRSAAAAVVSGAVRPILQWLDVALPSLLEPIAQLSQQLRTGPPNSTAAGDSSQPNATAAAAAGSAHSASRSSGMGMAGPTADAAATAAFAMQKMPGGGGKTLCGAIDILMQLLDRLRSMTVVLDQPTPKVWCASYHQLCSVFEGLVRAVTATAQAAAAIEEDQKTVAEILKAANAVIYVIGGCCCPTFGVLSPVALEAPQNHQDRLLLFSLQCSLLKLCSSLRSHEQSRAELVEAASGCRQNVVDTAGRMLNQEVVAAQQFTESKWTESEDESKDESEDESEAAAAAAEAAAEAAAAAAAAAAEAAAEAVPAPASVAYSVPWLALLGRFCLQYADALPQHISSVDHPDQWLRSLPYTQGNEVISSLAAIRYADEWLYEPTHEARLMAAGYSAELVEQLAAVLRAPEQHWDALVASHTANGNSPQPTELVASIREVGTGLMALALRHCCNNPSCSNSSKQSELALVAGRSSQCSQCRVARYCGKACQRQHWKQHKTVCKALAAAAPTAAAAGAGICPA